MIKRIMALVITAVLFCACTAVVAMGNETEILPAPTCEIGDVDMNFSVNVKDATAVQKHLAGLITLSEKQLQLADANLDSTVNIKDATYIQKQVAGLVEPMKPAPDTTQTTDSTADETDPTESIAPTTQATDPTESTAPATQATDPTESTAPTTQATDPTESTAPTTQATDPTESTAPATKPAEPTQPATRDPNKPIELPFVPVQ